MKKIFFALTSIVMLALTACEPKNQPVPPTPTPSTDTIVDFTVPKKHLIEEFTSQSCGYCPYGMDAIQQFIGNDTNWVLVLHHAGYSNDHFTITGSSNIASSLGVNGAPSMTIDRAKTRIPDGSKLVFHPGYLPQTVRSQFATTTYATMDILNTYDASTRELKVKVSGKIGKSDYGNLKLTVLVKESGMIDSQLDYYNTFQGWQEFMHANAVRAFLSAPKGNAIAMFNLALMYQYGKGTEENPEEAFNWYSKAAMAGDADGSYMTGWCIENSYGIKNPALYWYKLAEKLGSKEAKEAIQRIEGN